MAFLPASFSVSSRPGEPALAGAGTRDFLLLVEDSAFQMLRHCWYDLNQPPSLA